MSELIKTFCFGLETSVLWDPDEDDIPRYISEGFIPIEMAAGRKSYVDFRLLDHHNEFSDRPSACLTALVHYGEAREAGCAKFMVNHVDADCVMTGITLMGLLPEDVLRELNEEVGILDTEPLRADMRRLKYGSHIQRWKAGMSAVKNTGWCWLYGVSLFVGIIDNPSRYGAVIGRLKDSESERISRALEDYATAMTGDTGKVILIPSSRAWGLDVQFGRDYDADFEDASAWRHWCLISRNEKNGSVLVSCPNKVLAERVFGSGGLMNVFPKLPAINGKFWGGREAVGGSPRGERVPDEMLGVVLRLLDGAIRAI
ncbi:MAG: hypothetical protein LBG12_10100 [Synergistaceae bacterium]|jgi:hypothetical protein|nr:hypothetical protein [Synergistaceae bacterium]